MCIMSQEIRKWLDWNAVKSENQITRPVLCLDPFTCNFPWKQVSLCVLRSHHAQFTMSTSWSHPRKWTISKNKTSQRSIQFYPIAAQDCCIQSYPRLDSEGQLSNTTHWFLGMLRPICVLFSCSPILLSPCHLCTNSEFSRKLFKFYEYGSMIACLG
mgnify:CR=1 FL=1